MNISKLKGLILDILFPPICIGCQKEGSWLCEDCKSLIEIFENQYCPFCSIPKIVPEGKTCERCKRYRKLTGVFCAASYENKIVKKLIQKFKYETNLAKCLAPVLASLIITHFQLVNKIPEPESLWIPIPLYKKKLKERGFNQSAAIAKELVKHFGGELREDIIIKIRQTKDQVKLSGREREENLVGAFSCQNPELVRKNSLNHGFVKQRKIFLVDDVLTTGATLEECARILKTAGAKEVWGVVVARG